MDLNIHSGSNGSIGIFFVSSKTYNMIANPFLMKDLSGMDLVVKVANLVSQNSWFGFICLELFKRTFSRLFMTL